jgi:hypothetical protein
VGLKLKVCNLVVGVFSNPYFGSPYTFEEAGEYQGDTELPIREIINGIQNLDETGKKVVIRMRCFCI